MIVHRADRDLARRCADGDARAWEEFVRTYRPVMRAAAARHRTRTAPDPAVGPDDVAADLLAELVRDGGKTLREYEGRASLSTWVWVLARRRAGRVRAARLGTDAVPRAEDPSPGPAEHAQIREEIERLREGMERLPPRDRMILSLAYLRDWTAFEISTLLRVPVPHVRVLLQRARDRLRESAGIPVMPARNPAPHP